MLEQYTNAACVFGGKQERERASRMETLLADTRSAQAKASLDSARASEEAAALRHQLGECVCVIVCWWCC